MHTVFALLCISFFLSIPFHFRLCKCYTIFVLYSPFFLHFMVHWIHSVTSWSVRRVASRQEYTYILLICYFFSLQCMYVFMYVQQWCFDVELDDCVRELRLFTYLWNVKSLCWTQRWPYLPPSLLAGTMTNLTSVHFIFHNDGIWMYLHTILSSSCYFLLA